MTDKSPRVSLVVPLYNASVYTRVFLLALREVLPGDGDVEVVLVDNGSTDDTPSVLAELASRHRVVSLDRNHHYAGGCNRGAAASHGELLFFLNNDMVPTPGFVSAAVEAIDCDPRVAVVGCRLLFPSGTGAALLVRRAEFESLGGFDETYRNAFEDLDLCLRLRERGRRILYCPRSVLYHFTSSSYGRHDWDEENFKRLHARWHDRVEADVERLRLDLDPGEAPSPPAPSMTPEVRQLLADSRRDALAWRTQLRALETQLEEMLAGAASGPERRVLWLDCPDTVAERSGHTARVLVATGERSHARVVLGWRWLGEGVLPPPRTLELDPVGPVVEVLIPVEAPDSTGDYELILGLDGHEPAGPPAWRKTIRVRSLYGASYRAEVPRRLAAGEAAVMTVNVGNEGIVPWEGGDFRLSYHWRSLDAANPGIRDGWRIYLHQAVHPGESTWLRARVLAPSLPGRYALEWDVVHEGVAWFSDLGVPVSSHLVDVHAP